MLGYRHLIMESKISEKEASMKQLKDFIQQKRQEKNKDAIQDENLNKARRLWEELEDVPFDETDDSRLVLAEDWHGHPKGTDREEIWYWFEETFHVSVAADLMRLPDSKQQEDEFTPHVDWRGFTQQDFGNLQADRKYDSNCQFNSVFYAGDLQLHITDAEWNYTDKQIRLFSLDHGGTPEAHPHEVAGRLTLNMDEIRSMTYEDFQDKVESHLCHLIRDSLYTSQEEKDALIGIMKEPSPKSWAYAHILDLTSVSKELIRNDGKTLQDIEREWVKPNSRKNMLLHGSSKNLMKKLEASLKKDKEIKKLLSRSGR